MHNYILLVSTAFNMSLIAAMCIIIQEIEYFKQSIKGK